MDTVHTVKILFLTLHLEQKLQVKLKAISRRPFLFIDLSEVVFVLLCPHTLGGLTCHSVISQSGRHLLLARGIVIDSAHQPGRCFVTNLF